MKGVEQIFGNIIKIDICLWERERDMAVSKWKECTVWFSRVHKIGRVRKHSKKRANGNEMQLQSASHFQDCTSILFFGCCDSCTRSYKTCIFPVAFRPNALPLSIDCLNDYCIDSKLYRKLNAMNRETY